MDLAEILDKAMCEERLGRMTKSLILSEQEMPAKK